jgi:hypothetical protein
LIQKVISGSEKAGREAVDWGIINHNVCKSTWNSRGILVALSEKKR